MDKWFSYDKDGNGMEVWASEKDARNAATKAMQDAADELGYECFDDGQEVMWGKLVVMGMAKTLDDGFIMTIE